MALSLLARDGPIWVLGTLLKWPNMPNATMVVNDVFRILVGADKANESVLVVASYRAALCLENNERALLTWAMEHQDEFVSLMHLLQILTVPHPTPKAPITATTGFLNKLAQKLAVAKIVQEIELDLGYVPKLAHELRALPGFISLANDLVNDDEPRGGKAMHAFMTQPDKPKDMTNFLHMFTAEHPTAEQAREQAMRVSAAFTALFY